MEKNNDKQEDKQEQGKSEAKVNSDVGTSTEGDRIAEANKAAERLERATKALAEERTRMEKTIADSIVAGRSFAGQTLKQETADEKYKREAKERYKGTGLDPTKGMA